MFTVLPAKVTPVRTRSGRKLQSTRGSEGKRLSGSHLSRAQGLVIGVAALALASAAEAQAPLGNWYGTMSNFAGPRQARVVGGAFFISPAMFHAEGAIAVHGDIRTMGYYTNTSGAGYGLNQAPLGPIYTHPSSIGNTSDGTTDGTYNYTVDVLNGNVYRTDRDWQNPTFLFNVGPTSQGGITYDCATDTLWVAGEGGCQPSGQCGTTGSVGNYTLSGAPLSATVFAGSGGLNDLAIDIDGTFWAHATYAWGDELVHYAPSGGRLGSFPINLGGDTISGAEIAGGCAPPPIMVLHGGVCDCSAAPIDPASPSPDLVTYIQSFQPNPGPVNFDDPRVNHWFAHSFRNLPMGCITGATLTVTARPNGSGLVSNDTLSIGHASATGWTNVSSYYFGPQSVGNPPTLFPNEWNEINYPPAGCGATTTIDLATVVGSANQTILATLNTTGVLDIYEQDDTTIDCLTLTLTVEQPCGCPVPLRDNVEPYPLGEICGLGGWEPWTGSTDVCASVTTEQAASGTQSIKLVGNVGGSTGQGDDVVQQFNLVGGRYELSAMTFVPATATGTAWIVMLNSYPTPLNWSLNLRLDADNGTIDDFDTPSSATPLQKGVWVPVVVDIDLNADKVNCFYGGVQFVSNKSWVNGSSGGGTARIQVLDLYAGEPGANGTSGTYFDDLVLRQICSEPIICYPNCDGSTLMPILNVNDFACFMNKFASGDPYANCDGSTAAPMLNVNDFICFQQKFAAGCP